MLNKFKKISLRVMATLVLGKSKSKISSFSKDLMEKFPFSMVTESYCKYIVTVGVTGCFMLQVGGPS